jgi:uncharacterized protein YeaO (DUF488 family)
MVLLGVKRIYEKASMADGKRVLVDRLWPRGVRKSTSNIDVWLKDVAPSEKLRKWFNHEPKKWLLFKKRYEIELRTNNAFKTLIEMTKLDDLTLVFAAQDVKHNNAVALAAFLKKKLPMEMRREMLTMSTSGPKGQHLTKEEEMLLRQSRSGLGNVTTEETELA